MTTGRRGIRVTARDYGTTWFIGINGLAQMPHVRNCCFGYTDQYGRRRLRSEQMVYRTLKRLCDVGYLRHERTWHGDHGVYAATRKGLDRVGLDLAPATIDKRDYAHDLAVVDLELRLTNFTAENWITERQIRRRIKPGMSVGRIPDGLLVGQGGERWAVEREISGKETKRYEDIMEGYAERHRRDLDGPEHPDLEEVLGDYVASGGRIDGVAWYFESPKKRARARSAAERVLEDYDEPHHRFLFRDARVARPPGMDKLRRQQERERQEAEERGREAAAERRLRRKERERAEAVAAAEEILGVRRVEALMAREDPHGYGISRLPRHVRHGYEEALLDEAYEEAQRRQAKDEAARRRKEALKRLFGR